MFYSFKLRVILMQLPQNEFFTNSNIDYEAMNQFWSDCQRWLIVENWKVEHWLYMQICCQKFELTTSGNKPWSYSEEGWHWQWTKICFFFLPGHKKYVSVIIQIYSFYHINVPLLVLLYVQCVVCATSLQYLSLLYPC